MARLRVQEHAMKKGINLTQLHMKVMGRTGKPVSMSTLRRYWYSTKKGLAQDEPIELVDVHLLGTIAKALGVPVGDLLNGEELGQIPAAQAA
jgi:hypothetical protein